MNSLPKTVTRQCCGCDLNPDPSAPESNTLTTWLPSHLQYSVEKTILWCFNPVVRVTCGALLCDSVYKMRKLMMHTVAHGL